VGGAVGGADHTTHKNPYTALIIDFVKLHFPAIAAGRNGDTITVLYIIFNSGGGRGNERD
jgi:hypothetical protein